MKLSRILPVLIALAVSLPALALAQENPEGGNGGGGRGGNRGGGRGGRGGFNLTDQLKEPLGLTEDQVTKVKAIEDEMRAEMQKQREDMQNGGERPDFEKMRESMTAMRKKVEDKVKGLLTDEQKPKYDEFLKKEEERRAQWGGGMGGRGGPGGPGGPGGRDRDKEMTDRAEKELTLTADEKAAVMPLVKKVLEARSEARKANDTRREDLRKFLKDVPGSTDAQKEEIAAKLKDLKKAREGDESKVKEAENALREVLTPENEAKLMAIGIL